MADQQGLVGLDLSNGLGTRQFGISFLVSSEGPAGTSLDFSITSSDSSAGSVGPTQATVIKARFFIDNVIPSSATDEASPFRVISFSPSGVNWDSSGTIHLTNNGQAAGAARAGLIRVQIYAERTGSAGGTNDYRVCSDTASGQTLPAGWNVPVRNRGFIYSTTTAVQSISNVALGGAKNAPFEYAESIFVRTTLAHTPYASRSLTNFVKNGLNQNVLTSAVSSGTTLFNSTFNNIIGTNFRKDNGTPGVNDVAQTDLTIANSNDWIGNPWLKLSAAVTKDSVEIDPKADVDNLMQHDDNQWGTPPLSKHNNNGQIDKREVTNLSFLGKRYKKRRTGAGINNLNARLKAIDLEALTSGKFAPSATTTALTKTQGGEAGWSDSFLTLDSQNNLPGGTWRFITDAMFATPSIDTTYLVGDEYQFSLLAPKPSYSLRAFKHNSKNTKHLTDGQELTFHAWGLDDEYIRSPITNVEVAVERSSEDGVAQHLNALMDWTDTGAGEPYFHTLTEGVPDDALTWRITFPNTIIWGADDVNFRIQGRLNGLYIADNFPVEITGKKNDHGGYALDPFTNEVSFR